MKLDIGNAAAALALSISAFAAFAAEPAYPMKPVRLVVNSTPGAPPDVVARIVGERLGAALGQPVVVENRPGGMGTIALGAVAKAEPDGYTLGTMSPPHTVAPALLPRLPYDTARDLAPVTQMTRTSLVLVVRSESPLRSLPDLVGAAKAHPGKLSFSSAGNATPGHLAGELFKQRSGVAILHIPYKGGPASTAALLSEQVDMTFTTTVTAGEPMRTGRLRALATTGPSRLAVFPEVPTLAEVGFEGFDVRDWQGLVAPAGTPAPVVDRIAREVARALQEPDLRERLARIGMEPVTDSNPAAFGALIRSELARWPELVRHAGIRVD